METPYTIAVFPYLKTSGRVNLRGIELRSTDDSDGLSPAQKATLNGVRDLFYLNDDCRIGRMTYAVPRSSGSVTTEDPWITQLKQIQILLCYLYSSPDRATGDAFLREEHASVVLLGASPVPEGLVWPDHNVIQQGADRPTPNDRGQIQGFKGLLNWRLMLWLAQQGRIYPPVPHLVLNIYQDIATDMKRLAGSRWRPELVGFLQSDASDYFGEERLFTALTWYNRTLEHAVDQHVAILWLSIAFESLLGLQHKDKVTERFKDAVTAIVGPVPRLDSWLDQFYEARSQIAHEGTARYVGFRAEDRERVKHCDSEYRSLVAYGRHIFDICFSSLLAGSRMVADRRLAAMFRTNAQRFEEIATTLSSGHAPRSLKLVAVQIRDLDEFRFVREPLETKRLLKTAKVVARAYLSNLTQISKGLKEALEQLRDTDVDDTLRVLEALNLANIQLAGTRAAARAMGEHEEALLSLFIDVLWDYLSLRYFSLKAQAAQAARETSEEDDLLGVD